MLKKSSPVDYKMLKEHYIVDVQDNFLVHFPHKKLDMLVTKSLLDRILAIDKGDLADEELFQYLENNGLTLKSPENLPKKRFGFFPTDVTLFPTSDCNLRCVYCYGNAGVIKVTMDFDIAKTAIDFIIARKKKEGQKKMNLNFHGSGEPFAAYELVKRCVEYARGEAEKNDISFSAGSATNGVINKSCLEWLVNNFRRLAISIDGPKDIQDKQRPDVNGKGTYDRLMQTISFLQEREFKITARSTITKYNVERMTEMVEFFNEKRIKNLHFEPLFYCGRCKTTKWDAPDSTQFAQEYKKAFQRALELGCQLYYSGSRPGSTSMSFCAAPGRNFCITPKGDITSCYEVTSSDNPKSKYFFYGKIQRGKIVIYKKKLRNLQERTVDNLPSCKDCYIKWNCAGDCMAKYCDGKPSEYRCSVNKDLTKFEILSRMNKNSHKDLGTEKITAS